MDKRIYSLSACETSAQEFFETLIRNKTELVLDVRRRNTNQLCGFTKQKDLEYLAGKVAGAAYIHDTDFAPAQELLESYLKHRIGWDEFSSLYGEAVDLDLFEDRYGRFGSVCILGAATKKRKSHSDLLVDMIYERRQK